MSCNCDKFNNTGVAAKDLAAKDVVLDFFVAPVADDGTSNFIDLENDLVGGKLPASYIEGKINESDPSKRWYPVKYSETTPAPREYQTQGLTNGINLKGGNTPEGFVGIAYNRSAKYLKAVQGFGCSRVSKLAVNRCGNLVGIENKDEKRLYPIEIENGTFGSRRLPATSAPTVAGVEVDYQISLVNKDEDYALLSANNIETNLLAVNGLLDVCVEVVSVEGTNDGFVIKQTLRYGNVAEPVAVTGFVVGDYELTDSAGAVVALTSVTESPDGTYTFVLAAQPAGDYTLNGQRTGYELEETTITFV